MAPFSDHNDVIYAGMSTRDRRWHSLNEVARLLSEGKFGIDELMRQSALDRTFLTKRKRSPRKHIKKPPRPPIILEIPETSRTKRPPVQRSPVSEKPKKMDEFKLRKLMENHIVNHVQNLQPPLPETINARITAAGGCLDSAVFIIEKKLYPTDVDPNQSRLSIPVRQVKERFLLPGEVDQLLCSEGGIVPATFIDPRLVEWEIAFSVWKSNTMYVLMRGWKEACRKNELTAWTVVRIWAFRKNSKLCFMLETKIE